MIKTLNPFNSTEKTAEIMSRYRPIAPKPQLSAAAPAVDNSHSHKIRHSTFLRNVWPQLQSRPTRTRKRPRSSPISPHSLKRPRTTNFSSSSSSSIHPFPAVSFPNSNLVTLPLLPCPPSDETGSSEINFIKSFDEDDVGIMEFNSLTTTCTGNGIVSEIPQEKDLLQQLQAPPPPPVMGCSNVITPHPVRPVGSSIRVRCINELTQTLTPIRHSTAPRKPDEVEKEVESEVLPAVISDSNNKVRMANSAYREMVGQPECVWLDSMVTKGRRIGGEVMLHLSDAAAVPHSSNGFSCWVRIDWGNTDGKKNSITAFCDVIKLACVSRDYLFTWRFHTQTTHNNNDNNNASNNPICINV